jgi:filamentous hemagglutinin
LQILLSAEGGLISNAEKPIPKPGGGSYDHTQDLGNMLRGLRNNADTLAGTLDAGGVAARDQAQQVVQQIEDAIRGAGL